MTEAIAAVPLTDARAVALVAELDGELAARYPPEQRFGAVDPAEVDGDRGVFLVAADGGRALGCGALRLLDTTTAEVKRMYVRPEARGRRLATRILSALEGHAREAGLTRLVLETGDAQTEAIALYTRAGFTRVPCWGAYAGSPTSVCMAKPLG